MSGTAGAEQVRQGASPFEQRHATTEVGCRRCHLSHRGLDALAACPGFELEETSIRRGPGKGLHVATCQHISSGRTSRGYGARCGHPDDALVVRAAARIAAAGSIGEGAICRIRHVSREKAGAH
jgi:hypothetical protein